MRPQGRQRTSCGCVRAISRSVDDSSSTTLAAAPPEGAAAAGRGPAAALRLSPSMASAEGPALALATCGGRFAGEKEEGGGSGHAARPRGPQKPA